MIERLPSSNPLRDFLRGMYEIGGYGSKSNLSWQTGISRESFRRWEKGIVTPHARFQLLIARAFELTPEQCEQFGLPLAADEMDGFVPEAPGSVEYSPSTPAEDTRINKVAANLIKRAEVGPPLTGVEVELLRDILDIPHGVTKLT